MKQKAPFKRGQKLMYTGAHYSHDEVVYVKWWGQQRSSLVVVRFCSDGAERTVHVDECKPVLI